MSSTYKLQRKTDTPAVTLPEGFALLGVAGQTIFPVYGGGGCPIAKAVSFVTSDAENYGNWLDGGILERPEFGKPFEIFTTKAGGKYAAIFVTSVETAQEEIRPAVDELIKQIYERNTSGQLPTGETQ